jgi:hypothetical protein
LHKSLRHIHQELVRIFIKNPFDQSIFIFNIREENKAEEQVNYINLERLVIGIDIDHWLQDLRDELVVV